MADLPQRFRQDLGELVDDWHPRLSTSDVIDALEAEAERVQDAEGNRALEEWAA